VEHPFRLINHQFSFVKARNKGLHKNDSQLANLFRVGQMIKAWDSRAQNTM
jgi:IS5 family transposase